MKTQISREAYRWQQRYSGVYQQQGRMITDSDWNELVDILKAHVDEALIDVIGRGMPKGRAVQVLTPGGVLKFNPGYVYAGGLEGVVEPTEEATLPFGFDQQRGFPDAPPVPPANTAYRIYADVWDRAVVSLEDGALRDPALHGADTTSRTQRMAQLKHCAANQNPQTFPVTGDALLTLRYPEGGGPSGADPCDSQAEQVDPIGGDFLFRLEVHDVRWPNPNAAAKQPDRVVLKWSRENGAEQYPFDEMPEWFTTGQWIYELYDAESETHLGYNRPVLANQQAWTPKRGTLVTSLPQNAPAKTLVRRWEGYGVLLRSPQEVWSTSQAQGETPNVTAPGAVITFGSVQHGQTSIPTTEVSLADLEITLEVGGKVFLPGDYWTVPVRRATYDAGKVLVKEAFPTGVLHRYVTLADVQQTGQLQEPAAAEKRRLAFPRLTELDAEDIGYGTTCPQSSGLFTAADNTVEKALDRLCSINATHIGFTNTCNTSILEGSNPTTVAQALALLCNVTANQIGYTTTCGSGLFDNTHNTVKKALDRLCSIEAGHIAYEAPDNTSIYEGVDPNTVKEALDLLANVQAQQIGYVPNQNPLGVDDVKGALDELYARPVGNGSRVYIGPAGQYASIDVALSDLLAQNKKDIALALLPGDHTLPENWSPDGLDGINLSILGLGANARLKVNGFTLDQAASVQFDQITIIAENSSMTFNQCGDLIFTNSQFEGSRMFDKALIVIEEATRVMIADNLIDTQPDVADPFVVNILQMDSFDNIADLFFVGLTEFRSRVRALEQTILGLHPTQRINLGNGIKSRLDKSNNQNERNAYAALANDITDGTRGIAKSFEYLRHQIYVKNPGTSIQYGINMGPMLVRGNRISGVLGLGGLPRTNNFLAAVPDITNFLNWRQAGLFTFGSSLRNVTQIAGNVMAGMRWGQPLMDSVRETLPFQNLILSGLPRTLDVTDNVIENEDNYFLAEEVHLHGNQFTFAPVAEAIAAWVLAFTATYFDNRSRTPFVRIIDGVQTPGTTSMANANFQIEVVTVAPT